MSTLPDPPDTSALLRDLYVKYRVQQIELDGLYQQCGFLTATLRAICERAGMSFDPEMAPPQREAVNASPARPERHLFALPSLP